MDDIFQGILAGLVLLAVGFGAYQYYTTTQELEATQAKLASTTAQYNQYKEQVAILKEEKSQLSDQLQAEKEETKHFEEQIDEIKERFGLIEKTVNTDEELLKKYSKVFFLSENYVPADFEEVPDEYLWEGVEEKEHVHAKMWPNLEDMLEEAEDDGIDLEIVSAYRSFGEQAGLKAQYRVTYGEGANRFSAEQGYSEHQLGTTVDFTSPEESGVLTTNFENTEAYEWLQDNAHKYGFILSYPKDNSFYQFEPWHWRFVGEELADHLHDENMHFYDMPQREIDSYLPKLFDD